MDEDLKLISGDFMTLKLPPDKQWMFRHFVSERSRCFLVYYLCFKRIIGMVGLSRFFQLFIDHTGHYNNLSYIYKVYNKIEKIERELAAAEKARDFEKILFIKSGKRKKHGNV